MQSGSKIHYKNEVSAKILSSYQRNKTITSSPKNCLRERTATPVRFRQQSAPLRERAVILVDHEALRAEIRKLTI